MRAAIYLAFVLVGATQIRRLAPTRLTIAVGTRTLFRPFALRGDAFDVRVRCRGVALFHAAEPETSLCGRNVAGAAETLNEWAKGITVVAGAKAEKTKLRFDVRSKTNRKTIFVSLETVAALSARATEKPIRFDAERKRQFAAAVRLDRLPPNARLAVEPLGVWPRELGAVFENGELYLKAETWPVGFVRRTVHFQIKEEHSGLLSPPLKVRLAAKPVAVSALAYFLAFAVTLLFLGCSLLYFVFWVLRDEPAPKPANEAVSRWNSLLLSRTKRLQDSALTQASENDQQFKDVTLERISPLELTQLTADESELDGLRAIAEFRI